MKLSLIITTLMFLLMSTSCTSSSSKESTGEYFDSAAITTKVKAKLVSNKKISALDVKVTTFKNTVQLSGFVNSQHEKRIAEELALSIKGVKSVKNNLIVK